MKTREDVPYFWLSEQRIDREKDLDAESDYAAIFAGEASITPLHLDPTHGESLDTSTPLDGGAGQARLSFFEPDFCAPSVDRNSGAMTRP